MSARARLERLAAPGYSWCHYCGRPWKFVEGHVTEYTESRGCFPLCEGCWADLGTPEARLPYYRVLFNEWLAMGADYDAAVLEQIEAAVRAGG